MKPTLRMEPGPFVPPEAECVDLHVMDYQDITMSSEALRLVRAAGRALLERCQPRGGRIRSSEALSMFLDRIYFNERTGDLLMCADLPGSGLCLPIPKGHWGVRRAGRIQ